MKQRGAGIGKEVAVTVDTDRQTMTNKARLYLFLITVLAAIIVTMLFGCMRVNHGAAPVPGCPGAAVQIPRGCYAQAIPDAVEIRCPYGTNTYRCKGGK